MKPAMKPTTKESKPSTYKDAGVDINPPFS